jgi:protein-disulfide isomerase
MTDEVPTTSDNQTAAEAPPRFNFLILLVPAAFAIGLLVGYGIWGRNPPPVAAATNPQNAAQEPTQQIKRYPVPVDDDPSIGPQDAPITIIEFSDYECPFCKRWYDDVYSKLLETYPAQVRFVYRDFPLTSSHPNAQSAAEAANCANEQGKYWQYHDKLFSDALPLGTDAYQQYASQLGLDTTKFEQCLAERRYQQEVEADLQYAANLGINSTPTFFINGIPIVGAQPFEVFQYVIDKELAGELP